jgi:hypothetical protein
MDLNHLYSEHQLSLMRAATTNSCLARTKHLAAAGLFANRIHNYQLSSGATAAPGWLRNTDALDRPVNRLPALSS